MLTPKQFNLLATKEDLKAFATKEDLKALEISTKNDLKALATKNDLKALEISTKNDLKALENRMDKMDNKTDKMLINLLSNKDDLKNLEERMDKKMDKILTAVDGIAKQLKVSKEENAANQGAHDRMQKNIDKHEVRIKKLELRPAQFAR
jgi:hypothetical protein